MSRLRRGLSSYLVIPLVQCLFIGFGFSNWDFISRFLFFSDCHRTWSSQLPMSIYFICTMWPKTAHFGESSFHVPISSNAMSLIISNNCFLALLLKCNLMSFNSDVSLTQLAAVLFRKQSLLSHQRK